MGGSTAINSATLYVKIAHTFDKLFSLQALILEKQCQGLGKEYLIFFLRLSSSFLS